MEVVDPSLCRGFHVVPRTVFVLLCCLVAGNPEGRTQELLLAGMLVYPAEESGTKEVCVVNLRAQAGEGIAEACDRATVRPIELILQILRRAHGHGQVPCL